jgi:hypothetical protein
MYVHFQTFISNERIGSFELYELATTIFTEKQGKEGKKKKKKKQEKYYRAHIMARRYFWLPMLQGLCFVSLYIFPRPRDSHNRPVDQGLPPPTQTLSLGPSGLLETLGTG